MTDPTYVRADIGANPKWELAFLLSELDNDNAPIGWGKYIKLAYWMLNSPEKIIKILNDAPRGEPK